MLQFTRALTCPWEERGDFKFIFSGKKLSVFLYKQPGLDTLFTGRSCTFVSATDWCDDCIHLHQHIYSHETLIITETLLYPNNEIITFFYICSDQSLKIEFFCYYCYLLPKFRSKTEKDHKRRLHNIWLNKAYHTWQFVYYSKSYKITCDFWEKHNECPDMRHFQCNSECLETFLQYVTLFSTNYLKM